MRWILAARPLNLIIVFLTQYFFYHKYILPETRALVYYPEILLYPKYLIPFIIVTLLITAGGYLINDYFDFESDKFNKKKYRLENRSSYLIAYSIVFFIGLLLSLWIAWDIGNIFLSLIYLGAAGFLFVYSTHLKQRGLIGNISVALFSSFVIVILLYAESLFNSNLTVPRSLQYGILLAVFIFFVSLVREIIKDLEDIEGDKNSGLKTFPITAGKDRAKVFSAINLILFSLLFLSSLFYIDLEVYQIIIAILIVIVPVLYLIYAILKSHQKLEYNRISIYLKILMLSGLILFFFVL